MEKENTKLKADVKKSQESKVPAEKENMRMESVLMMNTELKGVLSVIKTYISSVLGGEGKITDAQQQFLGVVINKSARLERLINDLTELAKLEKGETKLAQSPVDINNIVQDIIFAIQPQADIKKVDLKVNFAPTLPTGYGDGPRLSSVTSQLLNQAIKVSPRGGQVVVETKDGGKDVIIRITDFGMSMPQSKATSLFLNFHGPESVAGPEFINTGLRFPIIKAVAKSMGGDIWIESEIGKGKTFVVSLPKKKGEASSSASAGAGASTSALGAAADRPADKPGIKPMAGKSPAPGGSVKIQRNVMSDVPLPGAGKKEEPSTVSDLLSFDDKGRKPEGAAPKIPGKDVNVPPGLLKKEEPPSVPPGVSSVVKAEEEKPEDRPKVQPLAGGPPVAPKSPEPKPADAVPGKAPEPSASAEASTSALGATADRPADKPKTAEPVLPDELPPLPDLEDDKGTDII